MPPSVVTVSQEFVNAGAANASSFQAVGVAVVAGFHGGTGNVSLLAFCLGAPMTMPSIKQDSFSDGYQVGVCGSHIVSGSRPVRHVRSHRTFVDAQVVLAFPLP